jgi:hypothetical protein
MGSYICKVEDLKLVVFGKRELFVTEITCHI